MNATIENHACVRPSRTATAHATRRSALVVAPGSYRARAVGYQFGVTETGTEHVAVTFEIADEGASRGKRVTWLGLLTGPAAEQTRHALRTCGWVGRDPADPTGIDKNEVTLVIVHEPRNGRRVARVKWINRLGVGRVALLPAMDAERKASVAARLSALAGASIPRSSTVVSP